MKIKILRLNASNIEVMKALLDKLVDTNEKLSEEHINLLLSDNRVYIYIAESENETPIARICN